MKQKKSSQSSRVMVLYLLSAIIAFGIICVWRIPQYVDVLGWDEGLYMQNGLHFTTKLQKAWGPVYAAWYYFLHLFQSNPLHLYLLNFQVLTVIPAVLFFIYWVRLQIRPLAAACVAMFFIASHMNFYSWPKISLFAVVLIAFAFVISTFYKRKLDQVIILAGGTILASYMRPELYLGSLALFAVIIFFIIRNLLRKSKIQLQTWILLTLLIIGTVGMQKWLGNPLFNFKGEGGRAVAAFGQHFAYNYTIWHHLRPDRWQLHANIIIKQVFGDVDNIGAAIRANPEPIYHHFIFNTVHYLKNLWNFYTDIFLPQSIFRLNEFYRSIVLILAFLGLLLFKVFDFKLWWSTFRSHAWDWFLLSVVTAPTFISVIVIFPREHYMVLQVILIATGILSLSFGFKGWDNLAVQKTNIGTISFIVFLLLIFAPNAKNRAYFDNFREPKGNFNVQAVNKLNHFKLLKDTIVISENEGGIICFLPIQKAAHFKWTPAVWKKSNFNHFADSLKTQMYYVTPLLLYDDRYRFDPEWQNFIKNYASYGYQKVSIAQEWYFLYDTSVLKYEP